MYQYYRIAAAVPDMRVADTAYNVDQMLQKVEEAKQKGVNLITFPELSVTGYTCGDLFLQQTLLTESKKEAARFVQTTADCDMVVVFGMPLSIANALYNVAVTAYRGHIYGITVKTFLPNYGEFYEMRQFRQGPKKARVISYEGEEILFDFLRSLHDLRGRKDACRKQQDCGK